MLQLESAFVQWLELSSTHLARFQTGRIRKGVWDHIVEGLTVQMGTAMTGGRVLAQDWQLMGRPTGTSGPLLASLWLGLGSPRGPTFLCESGSGSLPQISLPACLVHSPRRCVWQCLHPCH